MRCYPYTDWWTIHYFILLLNADYFIEGGGEFEEYKYCDMTLFTFPDYFDFVNKSETRSSPHPTSTLNHEGQIKKLKHLRHKSRPPLFEHKSYKHYI